MSAIARPFWVLFPKKKGGAVGEEGGENPSDVDPLRIETEPRRQSQAAVRMKKELIIRKERNVRSARIGRHTIDIQTQNEKPTVKST